MLSKFSDPDYVGFLVRLSTILPNDDPNARITGKRNDVQFHRHLPTLKPPHLPRSVEPARNTGFHVYLSTTTPL